MIQKAFHRTASAITVVNDSSTNFTDALIALIFTQSLALTLGVHVAVVCALPVRPDGRHQVGKHPHLGRQDGVALVGPAGRHV